MSRRSVSQRVVRAWKALGSMPGGKWLFSLLIRRVVPYSGTIGARVQELRPGYARITLRGRRRVYNHLNCVHAIALANLGELTTGLAVIAGMPPATRGILRGVEVTYEKKARGLLTCECSCESIAADVNTEHSIRGEIRDQSGDLVTVFTGLWVIGPER